jgi:hypothetical protein
MVFDQLLTPANLFSKGAAKIWSTSKTLHCSAFLASVAADWLNLPLIAQGKKQRGD